MSRSTLLLLFTFIVLISLIKPAAAFGAGNIPSYAYLEGKAFRHGDIEDILETIAKTAGGGFLGIGGGKKFGGLDIKRIYFGNLLRDYSQAVDIAGLKKLPLQTIINAVMVLTFLAVGYATEEFEVTKERLGCYLPTEHIDNPKGYGEGEDARNYDSRLRGPVDPRELEVDTRTGMKNYIANEDGSWDTSKSLVRRVLEACIHQGRMAKSGSGGRDAEYEAYRLLGTALHTLEDFTAHSNWCELTLLTMGHHEVFPHVGRNANVRAPNGQSVPILVTGTFGGSDFIHSLLGEAGDHLSSASVSDLNAKVESSRTATRDGSNNAAADNLRQLLFQIPGGGGNQLSRDMDEISNMRAAGQGGGIDPSQMTPQQLHDTLWKIMAFRDKVSKNIEQTLEKIPGLGALVEKIGNGISVFVFTTLEPYMKPLIKQATTGLSQGSAEVINSHDQLEVFRDPNASDPTHSYLSKDHFNLILNEPAGQVAQTIVTYAVERIVKAWDDQSVDARHIIEEILQCLHHPAFRYQGSQIQNLMLERFKQWFDSQGHNQREILNRLKADSVQAHKSIRIGAKGDAAHVHNAVLPDGGLQAALAGSGTHVPGNQYLNAGQDLLSGKMPWQQGFGTGTAGGNTAWRGMDDNHSGMAPPLQTSSTHYQDASSYGGGGGGGYNAPPPQQQHYGGGGGGGYNQPPPQQQSYGGGYDQQPSNDGYPGAGHGHGHGGGHHGGGGGGYGAPSYDNAPNYGGGGNQYGDNSYNQGPPGGDWQGQGGPPHHGGPPPPHGGHGGPQYGGGNQGYGGGGGGYGAPTYGGGGY